MNTFLVCCGWCGNYHQFLKWEREREREREIVVRPYVLFLLSIVLFFLLRFTDSDYPSGIFNLFLYQNMAYLRKFRHLDLFSATGCLCHKWLQICSVCRNHNPVLSSYMTYHQDSNKSNMMGATCGARIYYPSREHECKWGWCCSIVSFLCIVLLIIGCPFVVCLFGPLYCLPSFDSRHLFTSLASSNFSY